MRHRLRRSWIVSAALSALLGQIGSGCGLLPSSYDMEIHPTGSVDPSLQSLYVIVARNDVVAESTASPAKYKDLLDPERFPRYTSFIQYRPQGGTWKEEVVREDGRVSHEVDGETIEIEVDQELFEGSDVFQLVVLANYGSQGIEMELIDQTLLEGDTDHVIEVSGGALSRRDD